MRRYCCLVYAAYMYPTTYNMRRRVLLGIMASALTIAAPALADETGAEDHEDPPACAEREALAEDMSCVPLEFWDDCPADLGIEYIGPCGRDGNGPAPIEGETVISENPVVIERPAPAPAPVVVASPAYTG